MQADFLCKGVWGDQWINSLGLVIVMIITPLYLVVSHVGSSIIQCLKKSVELFQYRKHLPNFLGDLMGRRKITSHILIPGIIFKV